MEKLMTSDEVAELLHVDPVTVRRLITKGELAAYRIGSDYRVATADLTDYLQRQRIPAQAETDRAQGDPFGLFLRWLRDVWRANQEETDRFKRFTNRAKRVLSMAQEEAQQFKHNYIGTEHLLLGLLREPEGFAGMALSNLGVKLDDIRDAVELIVGRGDHIGIGEISPTPRVKRVLELSVDEAKLLRNDFLGTEHILLGLVNEGEGLALGILKRKGINPEQVRAEVMHILHVVTEGSAPEVPVEPKKLTAVLTDYLERQRIPAQAEREAAQNDPQAGREERDLFKRFTDGTRRSLSLAQEEAQRLRHNYIGTEHLLLGLIHEREEIAGKALSNLGVRLDDTRKAVKFITGRGDFKGIGEMHMTPRAKNVLELSMDEAKLLHHEYLGTEHILLGLVSEEEGVAAGVLQQMGTSLEQVRAEVMRLLNTESERSAPEVPAEPKKLTAVLVEGEEGIPCSHCDTRNSAHFSYCFNCGAKMSEQ